MSELKAGYDGAAVAQACSVWPLPSPGRPTIGCPRAQRKKWIDGGKPWATADSDGCDGLISWRHHSEVILTGAINFSLDGLFTLPQLVGLTDVLSPGSYTSTVCRAVSIHLAIPPMV